MEGNREACRLCLEYSENTPVKMTKSLKMIIESILPELNLELTVRPVLCTDCCFCLNDLYNFKTISSVNETKVREVTKSIEGKFSLIEVLECEPEELKEHTKCKKCVKKPICRLCFSKKAKKYVECLESKNVFAKSLPEVDLSLTTDHMMCSTCSDMLHDYYHFKCTCLEVENTLTEYRKEFKSWRKRVEIIDVVEYHLKKVKEAQATKKAEKKNETPSENDEPLFRIESVISLNDKNTREKHKEQHIESEINDEPISDEENISSGEESRSTVDLNKGNEKGSDKTRKEGNVIVDSEQNIEIEIIDIDDNDCEEIPKVQEVETLKKQE